MTIIEYKNVGEVKVENVHPNHEKVIAKQKKYEDPKTLEEAEKIKYQEVVDSLGGLPPIKIHCSTLATEALNKSIENYRNKKGDKVLNWSGSLSTPVAKRRKKLPEQTT